jgi:uncharacterized surface protein with fasciclin (FAS1) repeats
MKINQTIHSMLFVTALGTIVTFSSCKKKTDDVVTPPVVAVNTITDKVVADASLSLLKQAVVKAGLDGTLKTTGPFTVFAPDDAAFAASGITAATITSLSADSLKKILLYHTIGSKILAAAVPAGPNAKVVTAGGDSVFVTRTTAGAVYVNGIQVTSANIEADNGVIHKVNRVIKLPAANIVVTAVGAGLDSLVVAVTRATNAPGGDPTLAGALSNATLTVFAPTNAAFRDLLTALSLSNISQIPIAQLVSVLKLHVVNGRAFSSDLANGSVPMLVGTTTVNLTNGTGTNAGGPTIKGAGNGASVSNIIATNIMCRNGVVHLIDRVLLP